MKCSDCQGVGEIFSTSISCGPHGGALRRGAHRCTACHGTGTLPDETPLWRKVGADIKAVRERCDRSQREFARQIGVSPFELNEAEHGRFDPAPLLETVRAWERLQGSEQIARDTQ